MSIREYLERLRRNLFLAALTSALLVVGSVVLLVAAFTSFLNTSSLTMFFIGGVGAAVTAAVMFWRFRFLRSSSKVALWVEEAVPGLHYSFVTAADPTLVTSILEQTVRLGAVKPVVFGRIARGLGRSALLLMVASIVYILSPATSLGRDRLHVGLARTFPGLVSPVDKIGSLRIEITPPAYSGRKPFESTSSASISVLAGSKIALRGSGSPEGLVVSVNQKPLTLSGDSYSWTTAFSATEAVSVLRAAFNTRSRLIVIDAVPDKPPRVTLTKPLRDTTVRSAKFDVSLDAESADDIGLVDGYFEYLVVSGSGEAFSGRTLTSAPVHFGSRSGRMHASVDLSSLKMAPGDLVSIRAIARDNNSLTGPSIGTSDTRTFRIARADEYDSVSIEAAAPPPVDSSAMSQRMLIIMTEALVKKQKTLTRAQVVKQSDDIGFMEDRIRKRVYDILYQTDSPEGAGDTEEQESELQAINNPDLKQAYDALWDAVRSLRIAEPAVALPPMRVALKALDRARLAQRLYLRGAAPKVVVDIARVRLVGKEKGLSSTRTAHVADSLQRLLAAGFQSALAAHRQDPKGALEQFSLLRARALESAPDLAKALGDAIDAMQKNRDASQALLRCRRILESARGGAQPITEWGGG